MCAPLNIRFSCFFPFFFPNNLTEFYFEIRQSTQRNTGGHCSNSSSNIYDIPIRMVIAEWIRYEIITTIKCTISILIIPYILVGVGCTISSRRSCWFAARIYSTIYDECVGDVCCRILGYIHCQSRSIHDNSVVGDKFFTCFMHFYCLSASIKPIGYSINFQIVFLAILFFRSSSSSPSSLSIWRNGTTFHQ